MSRHTHHLAPASGQAHGSAAIARERLRSAISSDRSATRLPDTPRRAEPAQPDLLDMLLAQPVASLGGRP